MNKKSTLLAAALMAVSSLTVSAAEGDQVDSKGWTSGNYYRLTTSDANKEYYLSLCGYKADSVVFIKKEDLGTSKLAIDSALWEITKVRTETSGDIIYQFKNKKTKALLSFAKSSEAKPVLAEGVSEWSFKDGKISAHWDDQSMVLQKGDEGIVFNETKETTLVVKAPATAYALKAAELGESFSTFRLSFGSEYEGDIFSGKDLIAKDVTDKDKNTFVTLQVKGDESFEGGIAKYLGVDTLKTDITSATGAYGAQFKLDSTYAKSALHTVGNAEFQQFKFLVDLKNDSLAMFVYRAPEVNKKPLVSSNDLARVVFAQVGNKKVLTVSERKSTNDNDPKNGEAPFISVAKGTPAQIASGTGVYFLKSASEGVNGGKYLTGDGQDLVAMTGTPSVNHPEGQWYIKEDNGMYSIVDRKSNTSLLLKGEVFAVQGMENTYTFGGNADSIIVIPQEVDFDNKFLGSANFTKDDIANKGYVLNLTPAGAETSNTYAMTADSILQIKAGDAKEAVIFKLVAVDTTDAGGAKALGDEINIVTYKLKSQFSDKYMAYDTKAKSMKISDFTKATEFHFNTDVDGGKYNLEVVEGDAKGKFVTADYSSSNIVLTETPAYFNFVEVDAPEYGTFETGHKRFTSDAKSLTMNTLNLFAELKSEGQEILKSTYEKDNFSLKLIKSEASTAEMPLYFITTVMANEAAKAEAVQTRYYMVPGRDSSLVDTKDNYRVHFIANDTIETMKESKKNPALWALKVTESGNYRLESYQEMNRDITQEVKPMYLGVADNVVVMSTTGVEFSLADAPSPVANESIEAPTTIKVIGGNGEFQIRNAGGKKVTLSNILGQTIGSRFISSDNESVQTARGVVIVSVEGDKVYKVIVK